MKMKNGMLLGAIAGDLVGSVPKSIIAFLESEDYESTLELHYM